MAEMDFVSPEISLWWTQNRDDAGRSLFALSEVAQQDNLGRRARAAYNASLLEGIGLGGFGAWGYGARSTGPASVVVGTKQSPLIWNYPAAGLDTLQAKVVGQEEPKPMIMVTDGDWDDQRQAIWNTRLLEGLYSEPQGQYHDVWDLGRAAFKIAAGCTGTIAVKTIADKNAGRVMCELHDSLDIWIDAFECSYSNPLTYGEETWYDPHLLMAGYDDRAVKRLIWDAREPLPLDRGGSDESAKRRYMVKLVEGWRCKVGKEPGRYVAAIRTGTLDDKPWDYPKPPFEFLHARRSLAGFWGIPVMERGMRIAERINQIVAACDNTERLLPKNLLVYDVKRTPKELMKNISDVMMVGFNSEVSGVDPQYITPKLYDQAIIQLLEFHIRAFQETLGISQAQMTAQKNPGIVAAAAIRTVNDMFTELFSVISRDYTKFLTSGLGVQHLRAVSELKKSNPGFSVTWKSKGGSFMRQVKSNVIDIDSKKFVFDVVPVSETRSTPADRIQLADEMLARGQLSQEAYNRVVATGDLPRETKLQQAQYTMIEKAIDSWMHDDIEEISNVSPLPWLNHGDSITQVLTAYVQALMQPNFDVQRELYFRRWISQSDVLLKRQEAQRAAMKAAAAGGAGAVSMLQQAQAPVAVA